MTSVSTTPPSLPLFPGVPLSTQWGPQGYFYAIQIAQYGLSHYSKNLTEHPPRVEVYDTAEDEDEQRRDGRASASAPWTVAKGCSLSRVHDKARTTAVRQFSAPGELPSLPRVYLVAPGRQVLVSPADCTQQLGVARSSKHANRV